MAPTSHRGRRAGARGGRAGVEERGAEVVKRKRQRGVREMGKGGRWRDVARKGKRREARGGEREPHMLRDQVHVSANRLLFVPGVR